MSSQHALFITQCNIGFLATIALVALLLYVVLTHMPARLENIYNYVTGPVKINHMSANNLPILSSLLYHNLITFFTNITECFTTDAEFNGLSSAIHRNRILHSLLKI